LHYSITIYQYSISSQIRIKSHTKVASPGLIAGSTQSRPYLLIKKYKISEEIKLMVLFSFANAKDSILLIKKHIQAQGMPQWENCLKVHIKKLP